MEVGGAIVEGWRATVVKAVASEAFAITFFQDAVTTTEAAGVAIMWDNKVRGTFSGRSIARLLVA